MLAGIVLVMAWYAHVKDKSTLALSLLIVSGVIVRVYMASDGFLHAWDERFHALVAKNLIDAPLKPMLYKNPILNYDYKDWVNNHIWLHKQPFPLWVMSFSLKLFGNTEFALRLPSLLLSISGIWLVYDLGKRLFSKQVAFFAGFLFTIQGLILEIGSGRVTTDHIDLFFLVLVLLAVWASKRYADTNVFWWNLMCGVVIGLAILTKWLPALIVLPIWGAFQISKIGWNLKLIAIRAVPLLIIVSLVAIPWQLYTYKMYPAEQIWESTYNFRHFTETIEGMGGSFWYHFDKMRIIYGEIVYLPMIWVIYVAIKRRDWKYWALLIWVLLPFLFFSFAKTKMQGYTLFTAPAILLICGLFYQNLLELYREGKRKWLVIILMIGLIALPIRYSIERIKPFEKTSRHPHWANDLKQFDVEIAEDESDKILFNVNNPIEAMFYCDLTAYEKIPPNYVLDSLRSLGYSIYINKNTDIDTALYGKYNLVSITSPQYGGTNQ